MTLPRRPDPLSAFTGTEKGLLPATQRPCLNGRFTRTIFLTPHVHWRHPKDEKLSPAISMPVGTSPPENGVKVVQRAVLDTNVFVAAGFNPASASAQLLDEIRRGRLALIWNEATRNEVRAVLKQIPKLRWEDVAPLFRPETEYREELDFSEVEFVEDPQDRKFAALTLSSGAALVSADDHLLSQRDRLEVFKPAQFLRHLQEAEENESS
jgi:predicted nucleic acid-binding protein